MTKREETVSSERTLWEEDFDEDDFQRREGQKQRPNVIVFIRVSNLMLCGFSVATIKSLCTT